MNELIVKNLCLAYGEKRVIDDFSFDFSPAGVYALMAPSGSGKTSLLRALAGLCAPAGGEIRGADSMKTAFLFQEDRLLPHLTVLKNVSIVSNEETALRWLERLELGDKIHERPATLSGGQRRRVALARCAAFGGELMLLDEPFAGLDLELTRRIAKRLCSQFPHIIFATHSREEAHIMGAQIIELIETV